MSKSVPTAGRHLPPDAGSLRSASKCARDRQQPLRHGEPSSRVTFPLICLAYITSHRRLCFLLLLCSLPMLLPRSRNSSLPMHLASSCVSPKPTSARVSRPSSPTHHRLPRCRAERRHRCISCTGHSSPPPPSPSSPQCLR
jgi:hypothetical protein